MEFMPKKNTAKKDKDIAKIVLVVDENDTRGQGLIERLRARLPEGVTALLVTTLEDAHKRLSEGSVFAMISSDNQMLTNEVRAGMHDLPAHTKSMPIFQHSLGGEDYAVAFSRRSGATFVKPGISDDDMDGFVQATGMNLKNPEMFATIYNRTPRTP
jgi:hypothetical protein